MISLFFLGQDVKKEKKEGQKKGAYSSMGLKQYFGNKHFFLEQIQSEPGSKQAC